MSQMQGAPSGQLHHTLSVRRILGVTHINKPNLRGNLENLIDIFIRHNEVSHVVLDSDCQRCGRNGNTVAAHLRAGNIRVQLPPKHLDQFLHVQHSSQYIHGPQVNAEIHRNAMVDLRPQKRRRHKGIASTGGQPQGYAIFNSAENRIGTDLK